MQYAVVAVPEMEAFVTAAGRRPPGTCRRRRRTPCTPSCTSTCSPRSTGSSRWRPTTNARTSEATCAPTSAPTACSRRSSTGATVTWSGSTSTVPSCCSRLPGDSVDEVDIGAADLSHFRLEHTGDHNVSLTEAGDVSVRGSRRRRPRTRARDGAAVGDHRRAERPVRPRPRHLDEIRYPAGRRPRRGPGDAADRAHERREPIRPGRRRPPRRHRGRERRAQHRVHEGLLRQRRVPQGDQGRRPQARLPDHHRPRPRRRPGEAAGRDEPGHGGGT